MPEDFEGRILLQIRREFSKNEKYRLFLRHLDNVESELAAERRKNTELMKAQPRRVEEIEQLRQQIVELNEQLGCFTGDDGSGKPKFVAMKTHNKTVKKSQEFQKMYWELWHKHEELKSQFKKIQENGTDTNTTS